MKSGYASLARLVLVALLVSVHSLAAASTMYWRFTPVCAGDTVAVSDLNDQGVVLLTGFQFLGGGASATVVPPGCDREFFQGYGSFPPWYNPDVGVHVTDINNAGDALGYAIRADGKSVPTMWIGGVPFDLTDPANAGLHFNYDPGPKAVNDFDLWSLPVVGLPFTPDSGLQVSPFALTNARHDYVFYIPQYPSGFDFYGLLIAVVPEPGTLVLVLAGMVAALLVARGRMN
jgi:hypothetical protein